MGLKMTTPLPMYVVTQSCGNEHSCFADLSKEVRMASIRWHGPQYTVRSCGDVLAETEQGGGAELGCKNLQGITEDSEPTVKAKASTQNLQDKEDDEPIVKPERAAVPPSGAPRRRASSQRPDG